jgi:hypothetical protein
MIHPKNPVVARMDEIVSQLDQLYREADTLLDDYVEAVCRPTPSEDAFRRRSNSPARDPNNHLGCANPGYALGAHGYEATREAAMGAFAKSWRRE